MSNISVMLDLETLSQKKTACILSIGAVKFNDTEMLDEFYVNIDPASCKEYGLTISKETVEWWMQQSKEARDALKVDQKSLPEALQMFSDWFGPKSLPTFSNGASFDCVIMENAYGVLERPTPWKYWDERCFRTICAIFKVKHQNNRVGTLHNALDDAKSQVLTLQSLFKPK